MADAERIDEFVRLFTSHEVRLRAFVLSLVPNYADAEDVLQQANLMLWKKFDQFQPGTSFMSWAGRVVYLEAQQHRRRQGRDKVQFGDAFLEAVARETTRDEVVSELGERERALGECIDKLQPDHREMLRARYEEGGSIERMAVRFNRSAEAIYNALSRIRRALYECVNQRVGAEVRRGT